MSPDIVIFPSGCQQVRMELEIFVRVRPLQSIGGRVQSPDVVTGDPDILAFEQ